VQIGSFNDWVEISSSKTMIYGIRGSGSTKTLWAWGENDPTSLPFLSSGFGIPAAASSPVQVGSLTNWSKVCLGDTNTAYAIKTDGTLWAWGYNLNGQLGLGDTITRNSPVQVGAMTNWADCYASNLQAYFLKTDGTIWGTGNLLYKTEGLLLDNYSSPVQLGSASDWWKLGTKTVDGFSAIKLPYTE
jgi:hypothetical protein